MPVQHCTYGNRHDMAYVIIFTGDVGQSRSGLATDGDRHSPLHGASGTSDAWQIQKDNQPGTFQLCGKYPCVENLSIPCRPTCR